MAGDSTPSASVEELLHDAKWGELSKRLVLFACRYAHCQRADGEDPAQEAILRTLDPSYMQWDPAEEPDLFGHLCWRVILVVDEQRKTRKRHRRDAHKALEPYQQPVDEEEDHAQAEVARKTMTFLREEARKSETLKLLLGAIEQGVDGPERMAELTGLPVEEVRRGRWQLARLVAKTQAELRKEKEPRV